MRNKKKNQIPAAVVVAAEPTLEERVARVTEAADAAVSMFEGAANNLDTAALEMENVAAEAEAEMERLNSVAITAYDGSALRRTQAASIRNMFRGM